MSDNMEAEVERLRAELRDEREALLIFSRSEAQHRVWCNRLLAAISSNDLWDEAERVAAEVRAEMEAQR